ncbi:dipeptidase [Fervidibacillus halotolerans]|uniref:Dipeptidase n=1 Tax=Fervidibacillus halotolerans TaxID=2980027 RepID=A0A9E8RZL4_9BACI|nr:dipeptidase [Fervidibacillus halotolerans]WAA13473.1 dipeptidase [Fervidibacillus halotolerans]
MGQAFQQYLKDHRNQHLEQLKEFLKIPSISSLSEHKADVKKAAEWLQHELSLVGMENVQIFETDGHPIVYADWLHADEKPTVLIYGHYDVQPVDPIDLWETPPFEPSIRDEKIFARGASDDKGQVFMHIKAVEALFQTMGRLPVNIKLIIEGEEEIGSPHLPGFVEEYRNLLKADFLVISDTGIIEKGKPSICYGLRGLCGLQIDVKGAKTDLHSGQFGGAVQNAAHALVELLASFHDQDGKVTVEGFYDKVLPLTEEEKKAFLALNTDEEQIREELGVPELFGEKGFNFNERTWVRPTLEINGMASGFQGEGIKTVLPSEAMAKITCRLVPDQDPEEIYNLLVKHIEKHKPKGVTVSVTPFDQGAPFLTPFDHPAIQAAGRAYEKVYGVPTAFTRSGGSIPIVADFDRILGLPVVLMGFGLPNENFHAPNEHFHLENFDKGMETICHYWLDISTLSLR